MSRAAVLGAGSWGSALAIHLARSGWSVTLWARSAERAEAIRAARENVLYLPGHPWPPGLEIAHDLAAALDGADLILFVAPAQASRAVFRKAGAAAAPKADLVIASKGIEEGSLLRLTQVMAQEAGAGVLSRTTVLSGPSFAAEVARGDPSAVVAAGEDGAARQRVQRALSVANLRVYGNDDVAGVELAGALKNVMAIATGIVEGIGLGSNTRAALITRGLAEMARLGAALGGRASTFAGLAGMGDLVLTCTGALSRNRRVGVEIGRGRSLDGILADLHMVAEGVATTRATVDLATRHGVEMPIAVKVREVLFEGRPPRDAIADLLSRPLRDEA